MTQTRRLSGLFVALAASGMAFSALAADPLKIGFVLPMSGPFAAYGKQIEHGARLYLKEHNDTIAGRKVEILVKDDTGVAPEISKRAAQELLVKDKVDILAGFGLTPSAFAVAPLATEAKKPMVVMNAATSAVTTKSNFIVRTSHTLPQVTAPIASWAAKNKIKKVFTLVADYGPGHDSEAQFKKTFTAAGGEIVGEVRTPVKNPDFAPFLQKIKDVKPDAVFLFVPPGEQTIAFMKGFAERDLAKAGIRIIATGDLTDEDLLDAVGDNALGITTSFHYADAHKSPENQAYTDAYAKAYPKDRPNFMSVGGYDGMQLIAKTLEKTKGDASGEKFIEAAKGMSWNSPRGPVSIDPVTRDIVQTIYIRKVTRVGSKLQNVEFDQVPAFKDPGKQ
ncbi:MAG: ABC transporter substrate-binding protein [Zoogloea oleivorans]|jgi:branched-chain amino acid transport system substrate-binding protein|uniref:ABC transporter substrate-binding protein n=1 Tax=Zoogloea oleivorans TaxID=1552750 RepID=A0A6C2CYI7_9RHOO|nr:ABC transporter substrate-binding protein [Zoogloea oleivorans]MDY0037201.1 ABC transporter substrate-binding protein [Zoogloea oleivorans]TYC58856.1 ABC transporter substrate-binding protein [Zoogloea oleivorans]